MSNKGMTGLDMWEELQSLRGLLIRWRSALKEKVQKRKEIIAEMDDTLRMLGKKIGLQAGQQHAD